MDKSYNIQQTAPQTLTSVLNSTMTVTDKPTIEQWQTLWQTMQQDDLSVAYADSFPQTLTDFRLEVERQEKLFLLCLIDAQVGGAFWLHDLQYHDDGRVIGGWLGAYFLPSYRGRLIVSWWKEAWRHWESAGIEHLFSAIHSLNRGSQAMLTRGLHFHFVGRFPDFTLFHGQLVNVFIYTLHTEDKQLALELATVRAARQAARVSS